MQLPHPSDGTLQWPKTGEGWGSLAIKFADWFCARVFVCSTLTQVPYVWVFPFRVFLLWLYMHFYLLEVMQYLVNCILLWACWKSSHHQWERDVGLPHSYRERKTVCFFRCLKPMVHPLYPQSYRSFHIAANHTEILLLLSLLCSDLQGTPN